MLPNASHLNKTLLQGAVMFSSVISCLSWTNLEGRHWVGPAFWYASIGLAITSVVLAAQQMLVIDGLQLSSNTTLIRERLISQGPDGQNKPRRIMLHVWQVPTECLSYSISTFLVGLMSHIYSPVAQKMAWNSDAKVSFSLPSREGQTDQIKELAIPGVLPTHS